jgi:hypothetical protein
MMQIAKRKSERMGCPPGQVALGESLAVHFGTGGSGLRSGPRTVAFALSRLTILIDKLNR